MRPSRPDWLRPLVDALATDEHVGAACPKILFSGRFQEISVEVPDAGPIGRDERELGIRVTGVRFDGERDDERVEFDEGFHLPEAPHLPDDEEIARWSMERGLIRLRVADGPVARVALRISSLAPRTLRLQSGSSVVEAAIDTTPTWIEIDVDPAVFDVINNVGSNLYRYGFGGDRGFLERDIGQYEEPAEVFAWCGGAVLLRRAYLDDVGMFDEELFLYYEDTDLSWRGRLRGWRYQYVPTSVIRHRHAQSSGALVADVPLLHRTQPDARARQERAGAAGRCGRSSAPSSDWWSRSSARSCCAPSCSAFPCAPKRPTNGVSCAATPASCRR